MESLRNILLDTHLLPREDAEERLASLDTDTANALLDLARSEKMFPFVYETLNKFIPLDDRHHQYATSFQAARHAIDRLAEALMTEMNHVDYLIVKGKGIENCYPPYLTRHYLDIDMCVRDLDVFWEMSEFLLRHDLDHLTTMRLFADPDTEQVYGFARFDPIEETDVHKVEIQIGAYLIEHGSISRTFVDWHDLSRTNGSPNDPQSVKLPDREGNLLIYFAELLSRERLLIRDLFDVYFLTQHISDFDVAYLMQQVRKYHLQAAVCMLHQGFREHSALGIPPLIDQLYRSLGAPNPARRGFVWQHLVPYLRDRSSKFVQTAGLLLFRAVTDGWNNDNRFLSLLKWTDLRWNPYAFYKRGMPVYFAKINNLETHQLTIGSHDRYHYALTPIGSYAVTLHALLSDEEMDAIHEHIMQGADRAELI